MSSYHNQAITYRPEIDGLRAIAVLPVILFHAGFELFSGGYVGVDVFFVISGYLITSIILREMEQGKFSIVQFYERRARRILPALFFVIACCLPFAWMWMLPDELKRFGHSLVAVATFSSNIYFWRKTDYFAPAAEEQPLLHTWSLAVEEQFYVLFPLFLMLCWRFGKSKVFWLTAVVAICSLLLAEWAWRNQPAANFYLLPTRAWELLAGSLIAFLPKESANRAQTHVSAQLLSLSGFLMILYSIFFFESTTPFPSLYTVVPVFGTVLVIIFTCRTCLVGKILVSKVAVGVGLISYSAYLWHQPIFAFIRIREVSHSSGQMLFASFLSILLALFTWKFVEIPTRSKSFLLKGVLRGALLGLFICVFVGVGHHFFHSHVFETLNGVESRYIAPKRNEISCNSTERMRATKILSEEEQILGCRFTPIGSQLNGDLINVLWGDSHAMAVSKAFVEQTIALGGTAYYFGKSSCPSIPYFWKPHQGDLGRDCPKQNDAVISFLTGLPSSKVFLINRWRINYTQEAYRSKTLNTEEKGVATDFRFIPLAESFSTEKQRVSLINSAIKAVFMRSGSHQFVIVGQPPEFGAPVPRLGLSLGPTEVTISVNEYKESMQLAHQNLISIANEVGVTFFDVEKVFCDSEVCSGFAEKKALYYDDDHLSVFGAEHLVLSLFGVTY